MKIEDTQSEILKINTGVPQGSILGPLLFIIYLNDFPVATEKFNMINYADDTTLYSSFKTSLQDDKTKIDDNLNGELSQINTWLVSNKLTINVGKTKFMVFHPPQKTNVHIPSLFLSNTQIECVNEFNLLGLIINKSLNWNSHVKHIANKIARITGIMCKLKNLLPKSSLLLIYNSLILPHLNYGILCWGSRAQSLSTLQKKAIRLTSNAKYNAHTSKLFKSLNLLKISDIYTINILKFYYKLMQSMLPSYLLRNFVALNNDTNEYGTRQSCSLRIPHHKHVLYEQCLRYNIVKTINNCEGQIVQKVFTHSLSGFSNYAKKIFIDDYPESCYLQNCYICLNNRTV